MQLLALDTALAATAVAVLDTEAGSILAGESLPMARGQSEALLPMVERVVKAAGLAMRNIDKIAVTVGPGSFTGLRIGIAAARGLALALARPVVGVSTLAAFAAPALVSGAGLPVAGAIDARHGMIFFQFMGNDGRVITGPGLFSIEEAALKTGDGAMIFVGDAADRLASAKKEMAPAFQISRATVVQAAAPDIAWVARLGAIADPATAPARPLYLRDASVTLSERSRLARA